MSDGQPNQEVLAYGPALDEIVRPGEGEPPLFPQSSHMQNDGIIAIMWLVSLLRDSHDWLSESC